MTDTLADLQNELNERLKDPYARIMVTLRIAAMITPFTLDDDELETLGMDIDALRAERDALRREDGAVAGLVEAARNAHTELVVQGNFYADELGAALAPFEDD
jgi:hypothetical protein